MKLEEKFKNWFDGLTEDEVDVFGWYLDFECSIANVYELLKIDDKIYKESKYDIVRKIRDYQIKCIDDFVSRRIKDIKNLNIALGFDENDVLLDLEHFRYLYEIRVNRYYGFKALEYMVKRNLNMINFEENKINRSSLPVLSDRVLVHIKPSFLQCLPYDIKRGFVDSIIKMLDVESYRETIHSCESMDSLIELYEKHLNYYNSSNFRGTYELVMEDYLSIHEDKVNEVKTNKVGEMGVSEGEVESNEKDLDEVVTVENDLLVKDETSKEVEVFVEETDMEKTTNDVEMKNTNMGVDNKLMFKTLTTENILDVIRNPNLLNDYGYVGEDDYPRFYKENWPKFTIAFGEFLQDKSVGVGLIKGKRIQQYMQDYARRPYKDSYGPDSFVTVDELVEIVSEYGFGNKLFVGFCDFLKSHYSTRVFLANKREEYREFVFKAVYTGMRLNTFKKRIHSHFPNITVDTERELIECFVSYSNRKKYSFDTRPETFWFICRRSLRLRVEHYNYNTLSFNRTSAEKSSITVSSTDVNETSTTNKSCDFSIDRFTEIQKNSMRKFASSDCDYTTEMLVSKFPCLRVLTSNHVNSLISDLEDLNSKNNYDDVVECITGALDMYNKNNN